MIAALLIAGFIAAVTVPTAVMCNVAVNQRGDALSRAAFAAAGVWFFLGVFVMAWVIGG